MTMLLQFVESLFMFFFLNNDQITYMFQIL